MQLFLPKSRTNRQTNKQTKNELNYVYRLVADAGVRMCWAADGLPVVYKI